MALSERSLRNLDGVHPDLVRVVKRAAETEAFIVTEGLRNLDRQKQLVAANKSWTLDSRHLTGHAVDLCDPDGKYDIPDMGHIKNAMFAAAKVEGVPLVWGGSWKQRDTPHFELPKKSYPASGITTAQKVAEKAKNVVTSKSAAASAGVAVGTGAALPAIPAPPDLSAYTAWQSFGETVSSLGNWVWTHPILTLGIAGWIGTTVYWPRIKAWVRETIEAWRPA